jgi:mono/diheme cytochrome c family protein
MAAVVPTMLLIMLVGCRRSAKADGAVVPAPPSADAAPAAAPADTPPAGGDTSAAAAQDTGKAAAEDAAAGQKAPAETPAAPGAAPAGQGTGDVVNGWKQYEANCSRCHGQDALGSAFAPDLRKTAAAQGQEGFVQVVKQGIVAKGMPAFSAQLDDQQINDIYAYVVARGSGKLPPGRPAS